MPKASNVAAFFVSMLVTTFFTATSCFGVYLYIALSGDIRQGRKLMRSDLQKAILKSGVMSERITDAA